MRHCQAVLLAVLTGVLGGCLTGRPEQSTSLFDGPGPGPLGPEVVQMEVHLLERPAGDRYLNEGLWAQVDEQADILSFERKVVLQENGFRVGLVGGLPPEGLQHLLFSPRSDPDPRAIRLRAGNASPVLLGPAWKRCRFHVNQDGPPVAVDLKDAQCVLEIVPTLTDDGQTLLHFTPQVKHGRAAIAPRPVQDPGGSRRWQWESRQPEECYPGLGWEVSVAPGDCVVVGTRYEWADTLGRRCFIADEARPPVQRLLVVRAARSGPAPADDEDAGHSPPPLALQAAWTSVRGKTD